MATETATQDNWPAMLREAAEMGAEAVLKRLRSSPVLAPEWLSLQEAASYLGYSEQSMSLFVKDGRAPKSVAFSRSARRFKREWCDAWALAGGPSQYGAAP